MVLLETTAGPVQAHTSEQLTINSNLDCVFCSTEMTGLGSRLELTGAPGGRGVTVAAAQAVQPGRAAGGLLASLLNRQGTLAKSLNLL